MLQNNSISSSGDFSLLFEMNPCPMYIFDNSSLNFLDVNNAALEQYGYSKKEFLSLTLKDIKPAEDMPSFYNMNRNAINTYFDAGVLKHIKKNGHVVFVHVFSSVVSYNQQPATLAIAINIDKEVKIENALEEKISEIENILESITDGFYTLNKNWRFTYINREFERVLQRTKEEVIGKTFWDVFPEAKYLKFFAEYQKAMIEKTPVHFEEFYTPLQMWISVNAYPTKEGITVFFLDITEQKKIQEQLYNDSQNLSAIINNTKDIIWSIDTDFKVVTANKAFWERVEKMIGKPTSEIKSEDYSEGLYAKWQEYYQRAFGGDAYKITWIENNGDKTSYDEISFNPVRDRYNRVVGVSCFSRDITEQQNYQDRIEEQNKQLRQIAWLQSHKIRNHMANILGLTNLFNYKDISDPFNAEIITLVKQAANNMDEVIREISTHTTG
ncbi:MAG TPA: PAS domain-containing protein [Chitinophagaceae bacterium]|nr:PAS domain-containing protein [Chitinophagaceae bacterium]